MPKQLSRKAKEALSTALLHQAARLVEFRSEMLDDPELAQYSTDDIALQLTTWLARLPGNTWVVSLPNPVAIADGRHGYGKGYGQ